MSHILFIQALPLASKQFLLCVFVILLNHQHHYWRIYSFDMWQTLNIWVCVTFIFITTMILNVYAISVWLYWSAVVYTKANDSECHLNTVIEHKCNVCIHTYINTYILFITVLMWILFAKGDIFFGTKWKFTTWYVMVNQFSFYEFYPCEKFSRNDLSSWSKELMANDSSHHNYAVHRPLSNAYI